MGLDGRDWRRQQDCRGQFGDTRRGKSRRALIPATHALRQLDSTRGLFTSGTTKQLTNPIERRKRALGNKARSKQLRAIVGRGKIIE